MKYNTFRNITLAIAGLVLVGVVGSAAATYLRKPAPPSPDVVTQAIPPNASTHDLATDSVPWKPAAQPLASTPDAPAPVAPVAPAAANNLRDIDNAVLTLVQTAPVQAKLKDATKDKPYKVDLMSDDGKAWNRAKIDLNRNGKWDEKWSLKDGAWHREVAPADDETYSESYRMTPTGWQLHAKG